MTATGNDTEATMVEQQDAEWRRMLTDAKQAFRGGHKNVIVDATALISLFATLDTYREREAEAARPRVRVVSCMICGGRAPVGGTCPGCGGRV